MEDHTNSSMNDKERTEHLNSAARCRAPTRLDIPYDNTVLLDVIMGKRFLHGFSNTRH